jgi:hypothetical protein
MHLADKLVEKADEDGAIVIDRNHGLGSVAMFIASWQRDLDNEAHVRPGLHRGAFG